MIVFFRPLDSSMETLKYRGKYELIPQMCLLLQTFDDVVIMSQDTNNYTVNSGRLLYFSGGALKSKRVSTILSHLKYLRWIFFSLNSFHWMLKHRNSINLIVSGNVDSPTPLLFSRLFNIPYIIHYHYDVGFQVKVVNKQWVIGTLLSFLEHFTFRRANAIWVTAKSLIPKVKQFGARHVSIIPNWFDLTELDGYSSKMSQTDPIKRILFVGRLHPVKQTDLLIRAFSIVNKINHNSELYILGDGPEYPFLVKLAKDLGLSDCVHFLGFTDRTTTLRMIRSSDVLVLPSRIEGNPCVLIEAMMNNLPIIGTDVPGIKDMIKHLVTGYLIDQPRTEELANAIEWVISNSTESRIMAKRAFVFALENFSKESVLRKVTIEISSIVPKYKKTI